MKLTIDFETRSTVDLKKCGMHVYAEHPDTDVLCCAIKVDDQKPLVWTPDWVTSALCQEPGPQTISTWGMSELIWQADEIEAHNAGFEIAIWQGVCTPRYGWPELDDLEKIYCSAARAAMCSLPRSLDGACSALGLDIRKDKEGYALMLKMCKPRARTKKHPGLRWNEEPDQIRRLIEYCKQDVEAEYALSQRLPNLPAKERAVWLADQEINLRGIQVDRHMAAKMIQGVDEHTQHFLEATARVTDGAVDSPKKIAASINWLASQGVAMECLDKATVAEALTRGDLPAPAREFLEIRQSLGKSSTAKYETLIRATCRDGRMRGVLLYHGASTGRWSGKLFQAQNLPRGAFSDMEECIDVIDQHGFELADALWGDRMNMASTCIRGMLIPAAGHNFITADYSSIEARVLAWVAGQDSVLEAFRAGRDLYKVEASGMFGVSYESVDKQQRQIGKVGILSCIAEGQLVLTSEGLIPIEGVTTGMLLWDGEEFVKHDGVVFKGIKEVITYDGLTATANHPVFVEGQSGEVRFGDAASRRARLTRPKSPGYGVRLGSGYINGTQIHERVARALCTDGVSRVRPGGLAAPGKSTAGVKQRLSVVFAAKASTRLAAKARNLYAAKMFERKGPSLGAVRGAGNRVQVPFCFRGGALGSGQPWAEQRARIGSRGQQRALRARELTLRDPGAKRGEPEKHEGHGRGHELGANQSPLFFSSGKAAPRRRAFQRTGRASGVPRGERKAKKLAGDFGKANHARVYDIINAGPRHRFVVSGVLVHNCGYAGGIGAYSAMSRNYGIDLEALPSVIFPLSSQEEIEKSQKLAADYVRRKPDEMSLAAATACDIVKAKWRANNRASVALWYGLAEAAAEAVAMPGEPASYRGITFKVGSDFLRCRLPSGRLLYYPYPEIRSVKTPWGAEKPMVTHTGVDSTSGKWMRFVLTGGRATENVVQAVSRDLLAEAILRLEAAGYPVVLHVHDEIVAEVPENFGSLEEFEAIMAEAPAWAAGCPIAAEGWVGTRYRK